MSITVRDICNLLDEFAPTYLAESWDNVGLLVGRNEKPVKKIMVALDATPLVIKEAIDNEIDMLVTHHPLPFKPIKKINSSSVLGNQLLDLIENKIALYTAHTNLDATKGGTADIIAEKLGLENIGILEKQPSQNSDDYGVGRTGYLKEATTLEKFSQEAKTKLNLSTIQFVGNPKQEIKKVALCTGSAMDYVNTAIKSGADVYLTGDIKYHEAWDTMNEGIGLINASHFGTEIPILAVIKKYLHDTIENIEVIISENQYEPFITL